MDREFVEKVTRMVISTLEDMKENGVYPEQQAVKMWPHESPLPDPVVMAHVKEEAPGNMERSVTISPYI